jgi:hypothetical protein
MSEYDWFGHWFYFFIATGMYFISKKDRWGWALRLMGEVGWVWIGLMAHWSSISMWGMLFILIDLNGFLNWRKEDKENDSLDTELTQWQEFAVEQLAKPEEQVIKEYVECEVEALKRQKQREKMAAGSSSAGKKRVRSTSGRRSVKANGKRRSGSDAKPKGTKRSGRNVRVQKDNRRANAKGSRTSKV